MVVQSSRQIRKPNQIPLTQIHERHDFFHCFLSGNEDGILIVLIIQLLEVVILKDITRIETARIRVVVCRIHHSSHRVVQGV